MHPTLVRWTTALLLASTAILHSVHSQIFYDGESIALARQYFISACMNALFLPRLCDWLTIAYTWSLAAVFLCLFDKLTITTVPLCSANGNKQ